MTLVFLNQIFYLFNFVAGTVYQGAQSLNTEYQVNTSKNPFNIHITYVLNNSWLNILSNHSGNLRHIPEMVTSLKR